MTKLHGKSTKVLYAQFDHSNYYRSAEPQLDAGLSDSTCFGDGGVRTVPGLRKGSLVLSGLFDGDADAISDELDTDFQAATAKVVSVAFSGSFGVGERVYFGEVRSQNVNVKGPLSDVVSVDAEFMGEGGFFGGVGLHALTAVSSSSNSTSVDNAAATSFGAVAALHVTSVSAADTLDVKIQHSTDDAAWSDLITFTQAAAATSEFKTVTGTVNRYVRALWTVAGSSISIPFVVSVARLNN